MSLKETSGYIIYYYLTVYFKLKVCDWEHCTWESFILLVLPENIFSFFFFVIVVLQSTFFFEKIVLFDLVFWLNNSSSYSLSSFFFLLLLLFYYYKAQINIMIVLICLEKHYILNHFVIEFIWISLNS